MVKPLIHDPILLGRRCRDAGAQDEDIARDLADTLLFYRDTCVGMAANMIGHCVRIIAFFDGDRVFLMYNPELLSASGPYEAQEGCLSLLGGPRTVGRFQKIKVRWQTQDLQTRIRTFTGFPAQIIQHELDHCRGVLI